MKTILLMRHGKSDWDSAAQRDFERPLARRGREDVPRVAGWLAEQQLVPDVLLCSPAQRTVETLQLLQQTQAFGQTKVHYDEAIYEAERADLMSAIVRLAGDADSLMLIGHNPGLDDLVGYLVTGKLPLTRKGKLMTTAAVAVLECPDWQLQRGGCRLRQLIRPGELPG